MNLLILGGTKFLGRHLVDAGLFRGHQITLFNRGQTDSTSPARVERLRGERDPKIGDGLTALRGRRWDAVIDTSGYVPRIVRASAELLATNVGQYVFISSRSVYREMSTPGVDENGAVGTLEDPSIEEVNGDTYGPLKALCEQAVESVLPGRMTIIRPGLIVGPFDPTDRFTYWPVRISRGGEVLAPGDPQAPVQYIDARDLAEFILLTIERGSTEIFNTVGPRDPFPISSMLAGCRAVSGSDARFTWIDQDFLLKHDAKPWSELPLWLPDAPDTAGFSRTSSAKAIASGLQFRSFEETARDTLAWFKSQSSNRALAAGLSAEKERAILDAWHARVTC